MFQQFLTDFGLVIVGQSQVANSQFSYLHLFCGVPWLLGRYGHYCGVTWPH
jgi:hypothetical protein